MNMASVSSIAFILATLLALQSATADDSTDFLSPLLSPAFDNICEEVNCGKGKCTPSQNVSSFFFECECDPGWKQTLFRQDVHFKFLPCIIPNCTLNSACVKGEEPVKNKPPMNNRSFLDPCSWTNCGGGTCKKTSSSNYTCECQGGYQNLLNISTFPCLKECAIGMDCKNLGIGLTNHSTPPAPGLNEVDSSKNQAVSKILGNFQWLIVLVMSLAMV